MPIRRAFASPFESDKEAFSKLTEKQQLYHKAQALGLQRDIDSFMGDPALWWNKLPTLSPDDIKLMPRTY